MRESAANVRLSDAVVPERDLAILLGRPAMVDTTTKLLREVRLLRMYVAFSFVFFLVASLAAFRSASTPTRFEEIDVQRVNIREPDGKLRLVLSSRARSPGGIAHGKEYPGAGTRPGIIFYNDEETENGGLAIEGK